jgi:hypothetical protein
MFYFSILVKGNSLGNIAYESGMIKIKKAKGEVVDREYEKSINTQSIVWVLLAFTILIAQFVCMVNAIKIDIYKFPTLAIVVVSIVNFVIPNKNKKIDVLSKDLSTEEKRTAYQLELEKQKKKTLRGFIIQASYLSYFSYLLYILIMQ